MENLPETLGMALGIDDLVGRLSISVKANGMIPGFQHSKCDFKFPHPKNLSLFVGGKGVLMHGVPVARNAAAEPDCLCRRLMLFS